MLQNSLKYSKTYLLNNYSTQTLFSSINNFNYSKKNIKTFENYDNNNNKKPIKASYYEIYKFLKPYYSNNSSIKKLFTSFGITLLSKGIGSASPIFLKKGINSLIISNDFPLNITNSIGFISLSYIAKIVSKILNEIRNLKLDDLNSEIISKYGNESLDYINSIPYLEFKENSEQIISQITKTSNRLERFNRMILGNLMSNLSEIAFVSYSLNKFFGKKYLLTTLASYTSYILYSKYLSKYRMKLYNDLNYWEIKNDNKIYDVINNIDTIKVFQGEQKEKNIYNKILSNIKNKSQKVFKSLAYLNIGQNIILNSCLMINLINCVKEISKGKLTPGDIFMFHGFFNELMLPLNIMGFLMREIERCKIQLKYGIELKKNYGNYKKKNEILRKCDLGNGKIEFQNVNFSYGDKKELLKNLNLKFEPNKMNFIVGESGEGKSTIFELILKLTKPSNGKILINNNDINKINENYLRKFISLSPQNGSLFNESFLYNLLYPLEKYSKDDYNKLIDLLKKLNLYKKIFSLPKRMNTNLGTLGNKLSGGEKQRILLIRALLKPNTKILLFDEPTSNLDNFNSEIVLKLIKNNIKNKTVVINSHKLSSIKKADKIFVLHDGKICEEGSFNELISQKGLFSKILINNDYKNKKLL